MYYYDLPDDYFICQVCHMHEDECVCPECPKCGEIGNPSCYTPEGCGIMFNDEQVKAREEYRIEQEQVVEMEKQFLV